MIIILDLIKNSPQGYPDLGYNKKIKKLIKPFVESHCKHSIEKMKIHYQNGICAYTLPESGIYFSIATPFKHPAKKSYVRIYIEGSDEAINKFKKKILRIFRADGFKKTFF